MSQKLRALAFAAGLGALASPALADSVFDMLPDDMNPQAALRGAGLDVYLGLTQYYAALLDGPEGTNDDWKYGGKANLGVTIDGHKLGLWQGFYVNALGEMVYGKSVDTSDPSVIWPVNTPMFFPANAGPPAVDEFDTDLSLNFTQRFGNVAALTIGKMNMVDAATRTPLVGGGKDGTFLNIAFAAPPSSLLPPYIFGGMLSVSTRPANFTFAIYDPRNMQNLSGLEDPFSEGVAGMATATVPITINGRPGWQSISVRANNQKKVDLAEIGDIILPEGADTVIETTDGAWFVGYNFQQYLFQADPTHGWGIFGNLGFTDANPSPFAVIATIGLAGNSPIRGREEDRFGLGYFYYHFSDTLSDALEPVAELSDEQGIEAFYNLHLAPGIRLSADIQVVDPAFRSEDRSVYGGLSLLTLF